MRGSSAFKLEGMTTSPTRFARPLMLAFAIATIPLLAGCSVAENVVDGVVSEAQNQADNAISEAQKQAGDAISDALGGAAVSTDGELPAGFPTDTIPVVGDVQGGVSGPDGTGWGVRTTLVSDDFASAQAALEGAGFTSSAVSSDADSGFGTFTLDPHTVVLTVSTATDGVVTANYVVTVNGQ